MPLAPGTTLGPYRVVSLLGVGGMGEVYRARDPRLERDIAIKVLPDAVATDATRLERLVREARAVAALSHPNILAIFDVSTTGRPYLVTELLEGQTLREALAGGPLPFAQVRDVALQLLAGLHAAHGRGILHRDLKPENVYLTRDRVVKILDFGLAKVAQDSAGDADATLVGATQPGLVMGTPGYMAPEQVRGQPADARTDIFALGAILYEMLAGHRAFAGPSPADTMSAVLREEPPEPQSSDMPPPFGRIVRRCLAKRPEERFQTAADLRFALDALSDTKASAPPAEKPVDERSVAVLPFANMSADGDNQFFSDGLAEELINALGRLPGLKVASRTSAFRFRGSDADPREIGRQLQVRTILEGSVRRSGDRLRITAQLVNIEDGHRIWSERYDRQMRDVFDIQDEIVAAIVEALAPTLGAAAPPPAKRQTDNFEAYELYLRGRHSWHQRSLAGLHAALKCFEDVIRIDPEHALAHAGIADCYSVFRVYCWYPASKYRRQAQEAVARAVALDPSSPEVAYSQALVAFYYDRDGRAAERHLRRALALNPRFAEVQAYLSVVLASMLRPDEAMTAYRTAEELDPLSPLVHYLGGMACNVNGRYPEGERAARRMLELVPDAMAGLWVLACTLVQQGHYAEAIEAAEQVVRVSRAPIYLCILGYAYAVSGRTDDARRLLTELDEREQRGEYVAPAVRLYVAEGLGDITAMRHWANACVEDESPLLSIQVCVPAGWGRGAHDPEVRRILNALAASQGASIIPGPLERQ